MKTLQHSCSHVYLAWRSCRRRHIWRRTRCSSSHCRATRRPGWWRARLPASDRSGSSGNSARGNAGPRRRAPVKTRRRQRRWRSLQAQGVRVRPIHTYRLNGLDHTYTCNICIGSNAVSLCVRAHTVLNLTACAPLYVKRPRQSIYLSAGHWAKSQFLLYLLRPARESVDKSLASYPSKLVNYCSTPHCVNSAEQHMSALNYPLHVCVFH